MLLTSFPVGMLAEELPAQEPAIILTEPAAEEPAVEEPVADEPVVEEPVVVEPTAGPTAEPTPEPTAAPVINSLADDTSFAKGYVYTLRAVKAYDHPTRNDYTLTIAKGEAVYVVSRPNAGASKDRVEIRFNKDGKSTAAYVDANKVMYYQGDALASMLKNAAIDERAIFLGKNNTNPLLPVSYELYVAPTAEPLPTTQPDDGVTETIVDLPVADEVDPENPGKPEAGKANYKNYLNKSLQSTYDMNQGYTTFSDCYINGDSVEGFESAHSYAANADELYYLQATYNTNRITLNFTSNSKLENNYDGLIFYDINGGYVTYLTGSSISGGSVTVNGKACYLRLVTDVSVNEYGFKIESVVANDYMQQNMWNTVSSSVSYMASIPNYTNGYPLTNFASPHDYYNNIDYVYYLRGPSDATALEVTFSQNSQLEQYYDCLGVYDINGEFVAYFTGDDISGATVTVPGRGFYLRLKTDSTNTYYGFSLDDVRVLSPFNDLFGTMASTNTVFTLLDYEDGDSLEGFESAHYYSNNLDQLYKLVAKTPAAGLKVTFSGECELENNYDYVIVYDSTGTVVASYTGTELTYATVEVPGNVVYVRLMTDTSQTRYGFEIADVEVINPLYDTLFNTTTTRTVFKQTISYTNDQSLEGFGIEGDTYAHNVDEVYTLQSPYNPVAGLEITFADDCHLENYYDWLIVYDASGEPIIGYTGTSLAGRTLTVPGKTAYFRLLSDDQTAYTGFHLESARVISVVDASLYDTMTSYTSEVCSLAEYLNGESIDELQSPHEYANNTDLLYDIIAQAPTSGISLTFSNDTMLEDGFDWLIVYNGRGDYIDSYTGRDLAGETIEMYGNRIILRLISDESNTAYGFKVDEVNANYLVNRNLSDTMNRNTITEYDNENYKTGDVLPESVHNYNDFEDTLYRLTAPSLSTLQLTFNQATCFEEDWDYLVIYNHDGNYVGAFTGNELSNQSIAFNGNTAYLRLVSDYAYNFYGFKVTQVTGQSAHANPTTPRITKIYGDANGKITLEWTNPSGVDRYVIQRAVMNQSTGKAGTFSTIKSGTGATVGSYTDTTAVNGNLYAYRVRVFETFEGTNYYSAFANASYYSFSQPTITGEGAMGGTVGLRHMIRWTAVPNVSRYQVLRSVSETGTYGLIGETTDTSYIAVVGGFRPFWFKIRAFVEINGREFGGGTLATSPFVRFAYPDTVQNVQTSTSGKSVTITWDKISSDCPINGYVIYRCPTTTGDFVKVGLVGNNVNRYVDNTGIEGQVYYYRVRAYRKTDTGNAYSNISTPSNSAQVGYPAVPTGVRVENGTVGSVVVTWNKSNLANGYAVYRSTSEDGTYSMIGSTTNTTYTDKSFGYYGTTYYYKVRAYRKYNGTNLYSNYSGYDSVYTIKQPTLSGSLNYDGRANLRWTTGGGADGVEVEISYDQTNWRSLGRSTDVGCYVNNLNTTYSTVYFRVRAYYYKYTWSLYLYSAYSNVISISLNGGGSSGGGSGTTSGTQYRAVLIGQTYPGTVNQLNGPGRDRDAVARMMDNLVSTDYEYYKYANLTASGILSAIDTVASKADSDDITLVYYSGHGASGGYLCGTSGYVSPAQLRQKLDQYPGKKVVLVDACHSGSIIAKDGSVDKVEQVTMRELTAFDNAFVSAFADCEYRDAVEVQPNTEAISYEETYTHGSNDLAASGYYVITACRGSETSLELSYGTASSAFGLFTHGMLYGCGWNHGEGNSRLSTLYADTNGDKKLTLHEVYTYTLRKVADMPYGDEQHAQVYPTNSSQIIFGR